jgi:F-type H+-transporting ATPase subunit delta
MKNQKLAKRYAYSLLTLATEMNKADVIFSDMKSIGSVIDESKELEVILKSPVIKDHLKIKILKTIFDGRIDILTEKFIALLIKNNRETYLHEVVFSFVSLYNEQKNIKTAYITTAQPLNAENLAKLKELTRLIKADSVNIVEKVDKSIIGGFMLNVDDYQIDASVQSKLKELERVFSSNTYISDF